MEEYRYCVSFRIKHPNIDPSEITRRLQIEPSIAWKAGDPVVGKNGNLQKRIREESFWRYQPHKEYRLLSSNEYLEDYLERFTEKLIEHKEYFSEIIKSGGNIDYFIGLFSENSIGSSFSVSLLRVSAK